MPSLFRFLVILLLLGLAGFGLVYALGTFVKPATRPLEMDPMALKDARVWGTVLSGRVFEAQRVQVSRGA